MANPFKWLGSGIAKGLDNAYANRSGGLLSPDSLTPQQRAAGRSAALYDLGGMIAGQDPNSAGFLAANVIEERKRQEAEAAARQQQANARVQQQLFGQALDQSPQAAQGFALRTGNLPLAEAVGKMIPDPDKRIPLAAGGALQMTDKGPGFFNAAGEFIPAQATPVPGRDIEIITGADGEKIAVNKATLEDGTVVAGAKKEPRRLAIMKSGDRNLIVDLDAGTSAPLIDETTGKEVRDPAASADPYERFQNTSNLRKEFSSTVAEAVTVARQYRKIQTAAQDPSAAGDLSIIFAYMKMLDPGSVVRETEFANAENAAGVPEAIRNSWNRALSGTRLGADGAPTREDFLKQAGNLVTSMKGEVDRNVERYNGYAKRFGIAPDAVTFNPLGDVADDDFNKKYGVGQ